MKYIKFRAVPCAPTALALTRAPTRHGLFPPSDLCRCLHQAMLDLEGSSLTPILVSLVNKDASMLEAFGKGASDDIAEAKEALYQVGMG